MASMIFSSSASSCCSGRGDRGLVHQRLGAGDGGRRILRQPFGELPGRGFQFDRRHDLGDQAPVIGLLRGEAVLGQKDLQCAPNPDGTDHADGAAAVRRHADLGVGRREAGVIGGDAEIGDEREAHAGAGRGAVNARQYDLGHPPNGLDEGVIVLEQFADHGGDGVGLGGGADGLQVAAGAEGAAFALDHQHPDLVGGFDRGAELLQLLRDRKVDRVEGGRPIERNRGDRAIDPQQRRIVGEGGRGGGRWHGKVLWGRGDRRHLNSRRQEVTIPAKSAKCGPTFLLGRDALALP